MLRGRRHISREPHYPLRVMSHRHHGSNCDVTEVWKPVLLSVEPHRCYNRLVVCVAITRLGSYKEQSV
jgi:hypothetical protein